MSLWIAFVAVNAAVVWLVFTALVRRWATAGAVQSAWKTGTLLDYTDAALLGGNLEEAVIHANECARALLGVNHVVLVYLAEDRSCCRAIWPGWMNLQLGVEDWIALVQGPWGQSGVLTRPMIQEAAEQDAAGQRLARLLETLQVNLFLPGVDRGTLVCAVGASLTRTLTDDDRESLKLWSMSFLPTIIHRVATQYAVQQQLLAHEIDQAALITDALPSEAHEGFAGLLEWAVHENPEDRLGGGFWNAYRLEDDCLLVIAGEILAQGLAATMLSVAIRSCCDALFARLGGRIEPSRLLDDLNRFIWRPTNPIGMSCLAALFDPEHRRVEYAVAGRMAMVRLRSIGAVAFADPLPGRGPLVGDQPGTKYVQQVVDTSPNDVFFLLSEDMGAMWEAETETAIHLRLRIEDAGTQPLDELRRELLDALEEPNRRRGSTPVVVVRERGVHN